MFPALAPPSPAEFDTFPAPPLTVGGFFALPLLAPPRPVKKIAYPSIPEKYIMTNSHFPPKQPPDQSPQKLDQHLRGFPIRLADC